MTGVLAGILVFFVLLLSGIPIAFSLGAVALFFIIVTGDTTFIALPQRMLAGTNSFILISVPLFVLTGELMVVSGMTERLVKFAQYLVGWMRAGLAQVSIVVSMIFAGITGLAMADAAATGAILIPAMIKNGYKKADAAAICAAASTVGPIIPPSVTAILYAVIAQASVGRMFLGGIIPGVLLGGSFMLVVWLLAKFKGLDEGTKQNANNNLEQMHGGVALAFRDAALAFVAPVIVVGGVVGGIFTATESSAIAAFYSLLVGTLIYRKISIKDLPIIFEKTVRTTANTLFIFSMAGVVAWMLGYMRVPELLMEVLTEIGTTPILFLLLLDVLFLVMGLFLDPTAAMMILIPMILPVANEMNIDLVHLGLITILGLGIGLITPPVGYSLYIAGGIAGEKLEHVSASIIPFVLVSAVVLLLITLFPAVVTWIPNMIMNK